LQVRLRFSAACDHAGVEARIVGDDVVEELIGFEAERR
jgi:hypothetical protein